jgi:anti-sigma regulatory factor (Ser/Thr protein kinase)
MAVTATPREETAGRYRHEAFLYSGLPEYLSGTLSFIRRAVNVGDPILVVVSRPKIGLLRQRLGTEAGRVTFADMASVGDNPARIIAYWQAFVQDNPEASHLWGIGEPIYPGRSPSELVECQLHEALLNVAFEAGTPFWLLCPYDLEALTADVIDEARHSHPFIAQGNERRSCSAFRQIDLADPFDRPVPSRPDGAAAMSFESGGLRALRAFVAEHAERAGLDAGAASDMVLSVSEIATHGIRHGGGRGELRAWTDNRSFVCEVNDQSHITSPLAGRLRPGLGTEDGGGLWLANQLSDLVQIYSSRRGTVIRVYQHL